MKDDVCFAEWVTCFNEGKSQYWYDPATVTLDDNKMIHSKIKMFDGSPLGFYYLADLTIKTTPADFYKLSDVSSRFSNGKLLQNLGSDDWVRIKPYSDMDTVKLNLQDFLMEKQKENEKEKQKSNTEQQKGSRL
jgi:hypothetical protein